MNKYKVGELAEDDRLEPLDEEAPFKPMQYLESRSKMLLPVQDYPFNAMTNPWVISSENHFLTPIEEGYIRAHNRVPIIDEKQHKVEVFNGDRKLTDLNMAKIKSFKPIETMVCMRCAGHRRSEMTDMAPMKMRGVNFGPYSIYNAMYKGAPIIDVLKSLGVDFEAVKDKHLIAEGADEDFIGDPVQVSIPMAHALDPRNEVMLAYAANGSPLQEDHGYPVRLMVPGFVGIRSCKWLRSLRIGDKESECRFQKRAYKTFKEKDWDEVRPETLAKYPPPLGHCINSVISAPYKDQHIKIYNQHPVITFKGVAVGDGGSGAKVEKVELSFDGGKTWNVATITQRELKDPGKKVFSWVQWRYEHRVPVTKGTQSLMAMVRCYDSTGHTQDKTLEEIYNLSGTMVNSPLKVPFTYEVV